MSLQVIYLVLGGLPSINECYMAIALFNYTRISIFSIS